MSRAIKRLQAKFRFLSNGYCEGKTWKHSTVEKSNFGSVQCYHSCKSINDGQGWTFNTFSLHNVTGESHSRCLCTKNSLEKSNCPTWNSGPAWKTYQVDPLKKKISELETNM